MQRGKQLASCLINSWALPTHPFYFVDDLYGCVRLLTQIYPTLTTLYRSKIPLPLIKLKRSKKNAEHIDQINRSGIFERYNVVLSLIHI